jgi:hypothetical protein
MVSYFTKVVISKLLFFTYRVCQGLWPSLIFADEEIKSQNVCTSSKSHVAKTCLCMHFCINYNWWSNQGKYYEIDMHCAKQDVATWFYDEANIFQFDIIIWKHRPTGLSRLATRVTIPDAHGIHCIWAAKGYTNVFWRFTP